MAHEQYRGTEDANPVRVTAYFTRADSQRRNKTEMARSLAEFVKANRHRANPVIVLSAPEVPQGFGSMSIAAEPGDWWCGECGGITVSEIREQLNSRIAAKNMHAERYRAN